MPAITAETDRASSPTLPSSSGSPTLPPGLRLLVVEDMEASRLLLLHQLRTLGLRDPEWAENGLHAIAALRAHDFDLVLMDCQMPTMDGFEATWFIRDGSAGERHRQVPIIGMSGHVVPTEHKRCLTAGMDAFLPKPFSRRELEQAIRRVVPAPVL